MQDDHRRTVGRIARPDDPTASGRVGSPFPATGPREPPDRPRRLDRPGSEPTGLRLRPGAKALVRSSNRVLLVAERHADGTLFWTLPGGGVHDAETGPGALRREIGEELDCRAVVDSCVTSFWYPHTSLADTASVYRVYECALLSEPRPVRSEGLVGMRWAPPTSPPPRTLPQVRRVLYDCGPRGVERGAESYSRP